PPLAATVLPVFASLPFALLAAVAGQPLLAWGALALRGALMYGSTPNFTALELSSFAPIERAGAVAIFAISWHGASAAGAAVAVEIERPAEKARGEYAANIAMRLAKPLRRPPLEIAKAIAERIPPRDAIAAVEVAPPGFINIRLAPAWLAKQVDVLVGEGERFGRTETLKGQRIQVEFVSANPTGPMTIANARGGPIGDVLASVLAFHGATVTREYYVNDRGGRVEVLGESVAVRYRELAGDTSVPFPEDGYPAEYITEVAKRIRAEEGGAYEALPFDEQARVFTTKAQRWFVDGFKVTTERLGIRFDSWFFESELTDSGYFQETLAA